MKRLETLANGANCPGILVDPKRLRNRQGLVKGSVPWSRPDAQPSGYLHAMLQCDRANK